MVSNVKYPVNFVNSTITSPWFITSKAITILLQRPLTHRYPGSRVSFDLLEKSGRGRSFFFLLLLSTKIEGDSAPRVKTGYP